MAKLDTSVINDVWLEENGELLVGPDGDFQTSSGADTILQSCMFRLKTVIGDFIVERDCGASLEEVVGMPNSRETGNLVSSKVYYALTHDNFLTREQLEVMVIPVDSYTLLVTVIVSYNGNTVTLPVSLDLREGQIRQIEV